VLSGVLLNNSSLLGCDTLLLEDWFLWFWGIEVPSSHDQLVISSAGRLTRKDHFQHRILEHQTMFSWDEECVQTVAKGQIEKTQVSCNSVLLEMSSSSYSCANQKTAENIKHSFQKQKPCDGSKYVHDSIHILIWHHSIVSERSWESHRKNQQDATL